MLYSEIHTIQVFYDIDNRYKCQRKPNPETKAKVGTQDTKTNKTKNTTQKTKKMSMLVRAD